MARCVAKDRASMVRGSIVKLRRKCGKPNCRCVDGDLHETWVLSTSVTGRTRMVSVPESLLGDVRQAVANYRQARRALDSQALAGLQRLRRTLAKEHRRTT